jgi:hypothetical protein
MIDLEQEFEMLKRLCLREIDNKQGNGLLTEEEAEGLRTMVAARMVSLENVPEDERCPEGHTHDCGWSPSMGYHCY